MSRFEIQSHSGPGYCPQHPHMNPEQRHHCERRSTTPEDFQHQSRNSSGAGNLSNLFGGSSNPSRIPKGSPCSFPEVPGTTEALRRAPLGTGRLRAMCGDVLGRRGRSPQGHGPSPEAWEPPWCPFPAFWAQGSLMKYPTPKKGYP